MGSTTKFVTVTQIYGGNAREEPRGGALIALNDHPLNDEEGDPLYG